MPQLKAYHRPSSVDEALRLLSRPGVNTTIIGGGAYITARMSDIFDEVVDLQAIGLTEVNYQNNQLTLGAMVRLQTIVDDPQIPNLLREAAHVAGPNTLRNAVTVGGVVVSANKESEFLAALLVFEAEIQIQSTAGPKKILLTHFLSDVSGALEGGIITGVSMATTGKTARARVARTPVDSPIVAALARLDHNDRIHLALCGVANTPILVDPANVKAATNPPGDFRGSKEYRRQMAATLTRRVLNELKGSES